MKRICIIFLLGLVLCSCRGFKLGPGRDIVTQKTTTTTQIDPETKKLTHYFEDIRTEYIEKLPENIKELGIVKTDSGNVDIGKTESEVIIPKSLDKNARIFYWASVGLIGVAIIIATIFKQYVMASMTFLAGVLVATIPSLVEQITPYLAIISIGLIVVGIAYVFGKMFLSKQIKTKGTKDAAKLQAEGKEREAVAIMRAVDPKYDQEYQKKKES